MENHGFKSTYSPITENEQEGREEDEEAVSAGCCFGFGRRSNQEISYLLHHQTQRTERKESWVVEKIKKLKEFSEVIAGPKWKNFVRKVGKYCNPKKSKTTTATTTTTTTTWMYSPHSYAMNFDQGPDYEEEDSYLYSFTSRFSGALSFDQNKDDGFGDNLNASHHATVKTVVL